MLTRRQNHSLNPRLKYQCKSSVLENITLLLDSSRLVWRFKLLKLHNADFGGSVNFSFFFFLFFFFFSLHVLLQFHLFLEKGDAASLQHHFVYAILSECTSMDTWKTTNTYLQSTNTEHMTKTANAFKL